MQKPSITYQYTSTKEYVDAFPVAYRQWRATHSNCSVIHGYAFDIKLYFGTNNLDQRNWVQDFGGLRELKETLQEQFDHKLLVAEDDPHLDWYMEAQKRGIAAVIVLPNLGCEQLSNQIYRYINGVYLPDLMGPSEAERVWCYKVRVRETQSNYAERTGHREWNEDLFA